MYLSAQAIVHFLDLNDSCIHKSLCASGGERLSSVGVRTRMPGSWLRKRRKRTSTLHDAGPDERIIAGYLAASGREL